MTPESRELWGERGGRVGELQRSTADELTAVRKSRSEMSGLGYSLARWPDERRSAGRRRFVDVGSVDSSAQMLRPSGVHAIRSSRYEPRLDYAEPHPSIRRRL